MSITIVTSKEPAKEAGIRIGEAIKSAHMLDQNRPILLHIAGGSAMDVLDFIPFGLNFEYATVTCTVTDERFSFVPDENNFGKLSKHAWYAFAREMGMDVIDTSVEEGDTLESHAARFEEALRTWHARNPDGVVIGLFGVGVDGHTAGIIPGCVSDEEFDKRFLGEQWVATLDATGHNPIPLRVTLTLSYIRDHVDHAYVYAVGDEKQPLLKLLVAGNVSVREVPAACFSDKPTDFLTS